MFVVAFAGLDLVAQHAHLIDHQRQAILEGVMAARGRLGDLRDHDIRKDRADVPAATA